MDGELSEPMKAALLVAFAMKGEAVSEITGAALAMRRRWVPIPHHLPDVVDTCGTGGDGKGTFNISTAAALVAAAAGAKVAKHGNRSVSSRSGSADVLAALGVSIETKPESAARALTTLGISFLFAPRLHPAMKEVMPVRRELGVRTIFNVLGPLTNPAGARRQLMGVYAQELVVPIAHVQKELGAVHAMIVHGSDGLDELTTTGSSQVAELKNGEVVSYEFNPEDLGIALAQPEDLLGGEPEENAAIFRQVLAGEPGPLAEITALNAGTALYVAGVAHDLADGLAKAREVLENGAAERKLAELCSFR
jgi:anthranilate phosphoribosyltransferase